MIVQKKVNIAGLCLLLVGLFARMALGQHLGTWILRRLFPGKNGSLYLDGLRKKYGLC